MKAREQGKTLRKSVTGGCHQILRWQLCLQDGTNSLLRHGMRCGRKNAASNRVTHLRAFGGVATPARLKWLNAFATPWVMMAYPANSKKTATLATLWGSIRVEVKLMVKKTQIDLKCAECGESFEQYRSWQKFCSAKCRWRNWSQKNPRMPRPGTDGVVRFPRLPKSKSG